MNIRLFIAERTGLTNSAERTAAKNPAEATDLTNSNAERTAVETNKICF